MQFNRRNAQRATVMRPGTKEFHKDNQNRVNQFYAKKHTRGCSKCGSVEVKAVGGEGRLFVYCANCGKQIRVINTKPIKVGNWSKIQIYRRRAGLCPCCGGSRYVGKSHYDPKIHKFTLQLKCCSCGHECTWHNL